MKLGANGRVYVGTPKQIVQQMQSAGFGRQGETLAEYVATVMDRSEELLHEGAPKEWSGLSEDALCGAFINLLLERGLALELKP